MQRDLQTIAKWGKFLGYVMIVTGVLSALMGIWAVLVGAIPGVISIFLGLYLLRSAKQAEALLREYDDHALSEMLANYAKFLKLQGIYMIVALGILVLFFILTLSGAFFAGSLLDSAYYY